MLNQEIKEKLKSQFIKELDVCRAHKRSKMEGWRKNESIYYGDKKIIPDIKRANVDLARGQEFVHTHLSKIDTPLIFKFRPRKDSQKERVENLNALVELEHNNDMWDIKDIVGKKQAIIYGRAIYAFYGESVNNFKTHLEPVDVYDFQIDPAAGGINLEKANFLGRYGIIKTRKEIEKGVKDKTYEKDLAEDILLGSGGGETAEDKFKEHRRLLQNTDKEELVNTDEFKFWDWFTTYEGKRYHLLITDNGQALKIEPLKDVFKSELYPFWTYAAFLDLTEFWTPSPLEYSREMFLAQNKSINQMLDNAEIINNPMRVIDVGAFENLIEFKRRFGGVIRAKRGTNIRTAYQTIETPSIQTPIEVFNLLEVIQEKASGVTAGAKGMSDEEGKVGIYEGNQEAAADRFGLFNKSYTFGYKSFAKLFEWAVREHLIKSVAIDILGADGGVTFREITHGDVLKDDDNFGVLVEASNAEVATSTLKQRAKLEYLSNNTQNPAQNPKKAYEIGAQVAGFDPEEIRQLMDVNNFGFENVISEAARDLERIIEGEEFPPNSNADNAYRQYIVNYMREHEENLDGEIFNRIVAYLSSIEEIVMHNEARAANKQAMNQMDIMAGKGTPAPLNPNIPTQGENYEERNLQSA